MTNKTIGVILGGAGHLDGSEIHEATLTLYFLDKAGATITCFSKDQNQADLMNHVKQEAQSGSRNLMEEAARIARGKITDISQANSHDLDGLIMPGGFGVAKNWCDFATKGEHCSVDPSLEKLILELHGQEKPLGFICISPVIAAKLIKGVSVTLGKETGPVSQLKAMGAIPVEREVGEIAIDQTHNIISTPAYMEGKASISQIGQGIEQLVQTVLSRIV